MADEMLELRMSRVESAVDSIAESLKVLVKLEVHHEETRDGLRRAFVEINSVKVNEQAEREKLEGRVRDLEVNMPVLRLTSKWVIIGVMAVVGSFCAALTAVVIN